MRPAVILLLTSSAALLLASHRNAVGDAEAGPGDLGTFDVSALTDSLESTMNQLTEATADVDASTAQANLGAFLYALRQAEGTEGQGDAYRVCYGYAHTISDLSDHPAVTGEWNGERLPDAMCINAGFKPGCISTAAGAYQIRKGTWVTLRDSLGLQDFGAASQDAAASELIRRRGALEDVKAGRFAQAFDKCRNEWASLPGNYAAQGQRSLGQLMAWVTQAGGTTA
jgi:lysozyme